MFTTVLLAWFIHSILENEVQCAGIGRENSNKIDRNLLHLTENLTILKKIEKFEPQNEFVTQFESKNKTERVPKRNDKPIELDGAELSKFPAFKDGVKIRIPIRKNLSASNIGGRQPKFFGSLAFLAGLGAGGLATAASDNVNTIVKLLNGPFPVPFGFSRYYTGYYAPPPYLPVSYPVLYPVPNLANNYPISGNPIPVLSAPIPVAVPTPVRQNTMNNNTAGISRQNGDTDLGNVTESREPDDGEPHGNHEVAATQELEVTVAPKSNDDIVEDVSAVVSEESELRQLMQPTGTIFPTSTTTTTETPQPTSTITTNSTTTNSTEGSNDTLASTPSTNTSGYVPFQGYFGGNPQVVNNVMFTTEDPHQRYLKDYSAASYALPFERPAAFNPYQNVDTYSSPFVNSFSAGEPYPEFLNTVESNRYLYDTENRQNYNGFRPILK